MVLTFKQKFNKKYGFPLNEPHSIEEISDITGYKLDEIIGAQPEIFSSD